jgi:hypothetical protein
MQKKTRSLLEELQSIGENRDINYVIESRASNVITSAINLIEMMSKHFSPEKAELLEKRLLSAIKNKDQNKFTRSIKEKK